MRAWLITGEPKLVPNLFECVDRLLLHRGVHVMVRELSPREERRQAFDGLRVEREAVEDAREVLVRRLGRVPWNAVRREHALEAGVRGDDRAARVGLGPQVVERLVEDDRKLLSEISGRAPAPLRASLRDDVRRDPGEHEADHDGDRNPQTLGS